MFKIRKNLFETNSSSTHSLIRDKSEVPSSKADGMNDGE